MKRQTVSSGSPMEPIIGFARAVRVGNHIAIAGTAPIAPDGSVACPGDVYGQTRRCLEIARKAIEDAGGRLENVVRTRILLINIDDWKEASRAHGEAFAQIRPVCTVMQVSRFVDPGWLVEIEADAILD